MTKTIFITGASSGLGKTTAQLFQSKGWNVIATLRSPEKETGLSQLPNVTLLPLDVTDMRSIDAAVKAALALGDVDVVFNNAGYGLTGPLEDISDAQMVKLIDTNLLGVMRVTKAFIPYFRTKKKGLFITTSSMGGFVSFPFSSIYHATKWAIEGWSESMSFELASLGIGIKTVAPGGIVTDFIGRSMDATPPNPVYDAEVKKLYALFDPEKLSQPAQIAAVVYEAATDGKDQLRYIAGEDAKAIAARRQEIGAEAFRKELGKLVLG
ncbi:SDR family oxidoreductase [Chryseolinea lacunae]|uniref:SDR family oxidoreductase n=1 Tax=Chryseolinea lacunae TaxID=2801331 RepID=A0ABS1L1H1_9BACT|nr:SDR family oxidoreductase [Chryseolinea lacunae]MBL0745545.1 SDR family oxidoreductase [Chryseolinea lacunae]